MKELLSIKYTEFIFKFIRLKSQCKGIHCQKLEINFNIKYLNNTFLD
jgi:hypothetical protein